MFELIKTEGRARRGVLHTVHGDIQTPVFMNVGTCAAIKGGVTTVCAGPGSSNVIGGTFAAFKTVGRCIDDMCVKPEVAMKIQSNLSDILGK